MTLWKNSLEAEMLETSTVTPSIPLIRGRLGSFAKVPNAERMEDARRKLAYRGEREVVQRAEEYLKSHTEV